MPAEHTSPATYGQQVERTFYTPMRGVMGAPERSPSGNLVLRIGREYGRMGESIDSEVAGWRQTEHVVLTPQEVWQFVAAVQALMLEG